MSGLTAQGFVLKTIDECEEEIEGALRAAFGVHINTAAPSVFGQLKSIFAEREALLWEALQDLYNALYPDSADGISLDHCASITAHTRLPAAYSRISGVTLSGTDGTVVPAGTVFSVDGAPDVTFETEEEATLSGGSATVDCIATETGPISVAAGALTNIDTPISGLDSVTNPNAAVEGRDLETDAELRIRRNDNLQISNAGPTEAIRKAILALNEDTTKAAIEHCSVFENYTLETDSRGIPAKSIAVVVYQAGGVTDRDQEIADTLMLRAKPAGIRPHGDVSVEVVDSQGYTHTCWFSRPVLVPIYLELDLTVDDDYPDNGDAVLKDLLVEWGSDLGAGVDIVVYPSLVAQLAQVAGITDVTVRIGTASGPTGDDNVDIDDGSGGDVEMSSWTIDNITVTTS